MSIYDVPYSAGCGCFYSWRRLRQLLMTVSPLCYQLLAPTWPGPTPYVTLLRCDYYNDSSTTTLSLSPTTPTLARMSPSSGNIIFSQSHTLTKDQSLQIVIVSQFRFYLMTSADYRHSRWRPSKPEVVAAVLNSSSWPTSGNFGSVTDKSGIVANVGVAFGIGSQAHSVQ